VSARRNDDDATALPAESSTAGETSRFPQTPSPGPLSRTGRFATGLDLIEIERIRKALERAGFRERCFTETERAYCDSRPNPAESYAARFAGKEAVGKALGCGVRFTWKEIEIAGRPKPGVSLSGRTAAWAAKVGAGPIDLSMTHSRELAAAICIVLPAPAD
jgi:holo-[acyl-carrier protein] synthase